MVSRSGAIMGNDAEPPAEHDSASTMRKRSRPVKLKFHPLGGEDFDDAEPNDDRDALNSNGPLKDVDDDDEDDDDDDDDDDAEGEEEVVDGQLQTCAQVSDKSSTRPQSPLRQPPQLKRSPSPLIVGEELWPDDTSVKMTLADVAKYLSILQMLDTGKMLDLHVGESQMTLRRLLSENEVLDFSQVENHLSELPQSSSSSACSFQSMARSVLQSMQEESTGKPRKRRRLGPTYVLHRHLEPPDGAPLGYSGRLGAGLDLFTGPSVHLTDEELKTIRRSADTDVVLACPSVSEGPIRVAPVPLRDLAPLPSQSRLEQQQERSRRGQAEVGVGSGSDVTHLYYSSFSSFAPSYDSQGATRTPLQSTRAYLSAKQVEQWSTRSNRYLALAQNGSGGDEEEEFETLPPLDASTLEPLRIPLGHALDSIPLHLARDVVEREMKKNVVLLKNLQERQFDRLRKCQDSMTPIEEDALSKEIQCSAESLESNQLLKSLATLVGLSTKVERRQSVTTEMIDPTLLNKNTKIVPSPQILRRAQEVLIQPVDPIVNGTLQIVNCRAILESRLNVKAESPHPSRRINPTPITAPTTTSNSVVVVQPKISKSNISNTFQTGQPSPLPLPKLINRPHHSIPTPSPLNS